MRRTPSTSSSPRWWPAPLAWALGWAALLALDGLVDLANLALLLVLVAVVASLWLPAAASAAACALAVVAFNWTFVPPRHTFEVDLRQHALLLAVMLVVGWITSGLVALQRRHAGQAARHAEREAALRSWGETLRDADDPVVHAGALRDALQAATRLQVHLLLPDRPTAPAWPGAPLPTGAGDHLLGEPDANQRAGLAHCASLAQPMGPGTGRHAEQPDLYLPLRGRGPAFGAAVLCEVHRLQAHGDAADLQAHGQALCDQMGVALQRAHESRQAQAVRAQAQDQSVRNALLAAISHDYRTPLAGMLSAASALQTQAERLDAGQRRRLADAIADEVERLSRMTDNTLQLVRLDAPGVQLRRDWESAEELVGAVLARVRRRDAERRVRARLEPGLPLLWCDATLVAQLLENLVDNAMKYSPAQAPVEILVRRIDDAVLLAVRDRGAGIAPAWRERVFQPFHRGAEAVAEGLAIDIGQRAGSGVGLAVCRAIARAHGGELRLRARAHGGSSFEFVLPVREQPATP